MTGEPADGIDTAAGFSVAETARRVGVAASTLRTWERRYGIHPSLRTTGGHRRYTVDDVGRLQQLRRLVQEGLPTASAASRSSAAPPPRAGGSRSRATGTRERLESAVEALDFHESVRVAVRIVRDHGVESAWCDVFVPLLQSLGTTWARTGHGTEREHLATTAVQAALARQVVNSRPLTRSTRVLAIAAPEEGHVLAIDALAAAAAEEGLAVSALGTLPHEGATDAVQVVRPAVVVLWSRSRHTADYQLLRDLRPLAPVVCAAGPGWTRRRLPAGTALVDDLPTALASLRAWLA